MRHASVILAGLMGCILASLAFAQVGQGKVAGEVVRFHSRILEVRTAAGEDVPVKVTSTTRIGTRTPSDLSRIEVGSFIGTTAAPGPGGTLVASEVHIFPESMRGTGEGHRRMTGTDTMTNATVSAMAGAGAAGKTRTQATVAGVGDASGAVRLVLTYKGGQQVVIVPRGTPVMTVGIGDASLLLPGAHVIAYTTVGADGGRVASRVSVGKEGYVPPL